MLLNEVAKKTGMTKRAIKFYENKGLLAVSKDDNGYRNYTDEDITILREISFYRKLGICVSDIKSLLGGENKELLERIYNEKKLELNAKENELNALKHFMESGNAKDADEQMDYETLGKGIESLLPGFWGIYFKEHFMPFLNEGISTNEQKQAFAAILDYCDNTDIKMPLIMRLSSKLIRLSERKNADEMIAKYKDLTEEEYEKLKVQVYQGARLKNGILKYHPAIVSQRKFMRELQNKGYNDIFIPNMKKLSPKYKEYKDALDNVNNRICNELGLYYDADFNLKMQK